MYEMRPIKETYFCGKRPTKEGTCRYISFRVIEKLLQVSRKETQTEAYVKRELEKRPECVKRGLHVWTETYKRDLHL